MRGRVAVTGATGFIGWHICERLRDDGWTVIAIVRPASQRAVPQGIERVAADLDASAIVSGCPRADVVVHAAGVVRARSTVEYRAVNVDGTRAVVEAASVLDARLVHVSSQTAAGPAPRDQPCREDDKSDPITDYGRSKLEAESVVRDTVGLRWTILRPAAVYGPRDRQFLPLFQTARRGIFLRLPNAATFSVTLVHVDDVARAVVGVCERQGIDGEVFFIGHPTSTSMDELLETVARTFDRAYRPIPVPFALARLGAWLGAGGLSDERLREITSAGFVCSVERAEQRLGFRAAIDLAEGFRHTAAWYRANHWLD
jgi:nucleoside-diphosphate-sugar epimerase